MPNLTGLLGIVIILGLAYAFSTARKVVSLKIVAWGIGLQIVFAYLVIKLPYGQSAMAAAGHGVEWLLGFAQAGASFVFGSL
ncbi:MAG: Na+ dependent nucleoside transporter N-terminal domain-containing protein, partial [Terriglobales bacterium]